MKIILREEKRLLSEKELAILITTSSAQYLSWVPYFFFFSNGPHYQEIIHTEQESESSGNSDLTSCPD